MGPDCLDTCLAFLPLFGSICSQASDFSLSRLICCPGFFSVPSLDTRCSTYAPFVTFILLISSAFFLQQSPLQVQSFSAYTSFSFWFCFLTFHRRILMASHNIQPHLMIRSIRERSGLLAISRVWDIAITVSTILENFVFHIDYFGILETQVCNSIECHFQGSHLIR